MAINRLVSRNERFHRTADTVNRSHQILRKIDSVNRHVVQISGTGEILVLTPTPARFREIQKPLTAKMPRFT